MSQVIGLRATGPYRNRIGEAHGMATIADGVVDQVHELHEQGLSSRAIAAALGVSRRWVRNVLDGSRRNGSPDEFRRVESSRVRELRRALPPDALAAAIDALAHTVRRTSVKPTAPPTPRPIPEASAARGDITATLNGWARNSSEAADHEAG